MTVPATDVRLSLADFLSWPSTGPCLARCRHLAVVLRPEAFRGCAAAFAAQRGGWRRVGLRLADEVIPE
jgi:hypothetical protein